MRKLNIKIVALIPLLLAFGCNVEDAIYNTVHPEHGQVVISMDWSKVALSTIKPESLIVEMGGLKEKASVDIHTVTALFDPGDYTACLYNDVISISIDGMRASVNTVTGPEGSTATYVNPHPGLLFAGTERISVQKDSRHEVTVAMQQQVRELTLVVRPEGNTAGHIEKVEAVLSGIAGIWDFDSDIPMGDAVNVVTDFERQENGDYVAQVRLLGINGTSQILSGAIRFKESSGLDEIPIAYDLSQIASFAAFNENKNTPLTLQAYVANVDNVLELSDFTDVPQWTGTEEGATGEVFVNAGRLEEYVTAAGLAEATGLRLKGTLDKRDFDFMREQMPNLADIDLKEVSIEAYTNGTNVYHAGEFPARAFIKPDTLAVGKLRSIVLPDNITSIGDSAFYYCSELRGELVIPDKVKTIGEFAFFHCGFDGTLTLGAGLETIGSQTFQSCSGFTGALIIPDNVISIGYSAFGSCVGFDGHLKLGAGLETIGNHSFFACYQLTGDLIIPDNITSIGEYAFYGCFSMKGSLKIGSGLSEISQGLFDDCWGLSGPLVIPEKITSIGEVAFRACSNLSGDLIIPDKVTFIGSNAFAGCGFEGSLILGAGLKTIGKEAFIDAGFKGELIIKEGLEEIRDGLFRNLGFTGSLRIPDSVVSIGERAFQDCSGFNGSLTLGAKLETIGYRAFMNCSGFTGNLRIPDNVVTISGYAFIQCTGFDGTLTFGNNLQLIDESAFVLCSNFKGDLHIPRSVTTINYRGLHGVSGISRIYFESSTPINYQIGNVLFPADMIFYVPTGSKDNYLKNGGTGWAQHRIYEY